MSRTPNWSKLGITPHMRAVLIDWLIEVADEYHLQDQTLILAIMYLDGSLVAPVPVTKETLQLLGVTCMFLAAYATVVRALRFPRKHEEVFPPPLLEFAYITDGAYNADDVRAPFHSLTCIDPLRRVCSFKSVRLQTNFTHYCGVSPERFNFM